jgi:hypothetical protein
VPLPEVCPLYTREHNPISWRRISGQSSGSSSRSLGATRYEGLAAADLVVAAEVSAGAGHAPHPLHSVVARLLPYLPATRAKEGRIQGQGG